MAGIKPIPDGASSVTPHLVIAGAAQAIDFYTRAFGAVEKFRLPTPEGRLMHAEIRVGNSTVMLVDDFPEHGSRSPPTLGGTPITLHLYVEDADAVLARAAAAGARVIMPVQEMFWGDRYGVVEDPFGHRWSIATHVRDLSPEEIARAAAAAMA
ncbi:MAG: VOC family protein [Gammaproteobacteria bacterium]